jgi:dTDP-4-dehydrorhamnose reductase
MLLITGANGQLGQCFRDILGTRAIYAGRGVLDVADERAVAKFYAAHHYVDWTINCAAYTNVDGAEDNVDAAWALNVLAPKFLAKYGRRLLHFSTDYVFDGTAGRPLSEYDQPNPQSVYGMTKLAGEWKAMKESGGGAVIIRTSWLYSGYGKNFVKTMQGLGASRDKIDVVADQIGTPTYAPDLAAAALKLIDSNAPGGIYHYSDEGASSWYDFAVRIMELSDLPCKVRPISSAGYPQRAERPAYSVLDKSKIKGAAGVEIPHWGESLARYIKGASK